MFHLTFHCKCRSSWKAKTGHGARISRKVLQTSIGAAARVAAIVLGHFNVPLARGRGAREKEGGRVARVRSVDNH